MAHKESEELKTDERYPLGEYSFRIERSAGTSPNYDKIEAICTKDGKNARKSIQVLSNTQLLGWYVEANSDTADVYVNLKSSSSPEPELDITPWVRPILTTDALEIITTGDYHYRYIFSGCVAACGLEPNNIDAQIFFASSSPGGTYRRDYFYNGNWLIGGTLPVTGEYTYDDKKVYYTYILGMTVKEIISGTVNNLTDNSFLHPAEIAWTMVYGSSPPQPEEEKTVLVGRFAIEAEEAGGAGIDSDWSDPGDYDYDDYPDPDERDPEDPTYTLNLEVVGALSGRHNYPIEDTSYSYIPADKATVKDYGCGGDGGNGGGGGAGASNIVVYKFATSRADSKEIVTKVKRHGYGSGGGKGGKGGDGCILIYY